MPTNSNTHRGRPTVGQIGRRPLVRTSDDPLARLNGKWEVVVNEQRVHGPDTLAACIVEAREISNGVTA